MFYNFHMAKYSIRTVKEKKEIVAYHKKHGWIPTIEKYNISRSTIVHWLERIKKADNSPTKRIRDTQTFSQHKSAEINLLFPILAVIIRV